MAALERAKVQAAERQREHSIAGWIRARNEGVREGLLMAMAAVHLLPGDQAFLDAIIARGDRHFGDTDWQTRPRPA